MNSNINVSGCRPFAGKPCTRVSFSMGDDKHRHLFDRDFYDGEHPLETALKLRQIVELIEGCIGSMRAE